MELWRCDLLLRPHIDFPSPVLDCIGSIVHQQSLLLDECKCDIRPPFPRGTRRVRTLSPDKIWRSRAASKSSKKDSQVKQFPCFFLRRIWSFSFFMINYNSVNILLYVYVNISIYIYTHIVEAWLSPSSIIPIDPGWPGMTRAWFSLKPRLQGRHCCSAVRFSKSWHFKHSLPSPGLPREWMKVNSESLQTWIFSYWLYTRVGTNVWISLLKIAMNLYDLF